MVGGGGGGGGVITPQWLLLFLTSYTNTVLPIFTAMCA